MKARSLRGTLLVIKNCMEHVSIERDRTSKPVIVEVVGAWTAEELREAMSYWKGSDAARF